MKNIQKQAKNILITLVLAVFFSNVFAQTPGDTVKTDKPNDPMAVKPAHPNDDMTMKPGTTNDANAVMTDTGFINKNIADNLMEIQLSKIGLSKGTGMQIKKIASTMITDHTAMLSDLKKLAAARHGSSKANNMSPDLPQSSMKPSKDFNQVWATQMLTMHESKITELENFMSVTQDAQLKTLISKALVKIKMHRDALAKIPGVSSDGGSKVI